jgi:DNA-binding NarL/FixJ family response regulator
MKDSAVKLMVVDDHQMFIDGIKAILKSSPEIKVVAEALSGAKALEIIEKVRPQVLITDISMPEMTGDELTKIITRRYPEINVLALSMHNNIETINLMINAGVKGYILKNTGKKELIDAVLTVSMGKNYFSVEVKDALLEKYISTSANEEKPVKNTAKKVYLTRREKQIIKLVIDGYSNTEIAEKLNLSVYTITSHRRNIYSKTMVNNVASLIDYIREEDIDLNLSPINNE